MHHPVAAGSPAPDHRDPALTATESSLRMDPSAGSDAGLGHACTHMYTRLCAHTRTCFTAHHTPRVLGRLHVRKCAHCTQGTRGAEPRPQESTAAARALPTLLPVIALKQEDETELRGGVARKKLWHAGGLAVPNWSGRGSPPAPGAGQRGCASRKQALPPGQAWPCCGPPRAWEAVEVLALAHKDSPNLDRTSCCSSRLEKRILGFSPLMLELSQGGASRLGLSRGSTSTSRLTWNRSGYFS